MKVFILSHHNGGAPGDSPEPSVYSNRADAIKALKKYKEEMLECFEEDDYELYDDTDYEFYIDTGGDFWEYTMITEREIQ